MTSGQRKTIGKEVAEEYKWTGPSIHEDKSNVYYQAIYVSTKHGTFTFNVGDTVYFHADVNQPPFIGEIQKLYQKKTTNVQYVEPRWFYRPQDVRKLGSRSLLNRITNDVSKDVFFSTDGDENRVQSLLRPCEVIYYTDDDVEKNEIELATLSKDTFICRYIFKSKSTNGGIADMSKLKKSDLLTSLEKNQQYRSTLIPATTIVDNSEYDNTYSWCQP